MSIELRSHGLCCCCYDDERTVVYPVVRDPKRLPLPLKLKEIEKHKGEFGGDDKLKLVEMTPSCRIRQDFLFGFFRASLNPLWLITKTCTVHTQVPDRSSFQVGPRPSRTFHRSVRASH